MSCIDQLNSQEQSKLSLDHHHHTSTSSYICLGARSIQHCNVLSEKINFSAHSARRAAIFWTDHLDALNLKVLFFSWLSDPPLCLKMAKCAIFSHFCRTHFENTPKVGLHREKFYIGNFSQNFFGDFYICWECPISISEKFSIKNFSRWPTTSESPGTHWLFEIGLKIRKL